MFENPIVEQLDPNAFEMVPVSKICQGDTIFYEGYWRTVSLSDVRYDPFMGHSVFGDSFRFGKTLVKRKLYINWGLVNNPDFNCTDINQLYTTQR